MAALAAQGPTNREIAQTLFVTEKTARQGERSSQWWNHHDAYGEG